MTTGENTNRMVDQAEIVSSLEPINGIYFNIGDLYEYAKKVVALGKSIEIRQEQSDKLISYVLYYDNGPEMFVTMVWTHPDHQGRGLAGKLLRQLIDSSSKDIRLEVHKDSPAIQLYKSAGFVFTEKLDDSYVMLLRKQIAIMQPYVFPYIGYFHLIDASQLFVFYDDVHFVKKGWINRNRILLNGKDHLFTVPLSSVSQNALINQTMLSTNNEWTAKFNTTLTHCYRKAPYFSRAIDVINSVSNASKCNISDMAINSIASVYDYLGMDFNYTKSSICSPGTQGIDKADRLIEVTKSLGYKRYINSAGGKELYSKEYFSKNGVTLSFVESEDVKYKQFSDEFVPRLSIIDVMMFNDVSEIKELLTKYKTDQ